MSKFDFIALLDRNHIEYVDSGPNVKRGNVNIKCPFCGPRDPSHHLGIDPDTNYWACWRDKTHRGKSPIRLVMALLRCDYDTAKNIVVDKSDTLDESVLSSIAEGSYFNSQDYGQEGQDSDNASLQYPNTIRPFDGKYRVEDKFKGYLRDVRGFTEVDSLIRAYKLAYAVTGRFSDRIIFPYFGEGTRMVTFSGRSIHRGSSLRYKELSKDESIIHSKQTLYNANLALSGGKVLFVVEGPMDVLKLDHYGKHLGCRSVGLSSVALQDSQLLLMMKLASKFDRTCLVVDDGYVSQQQQILDAMEVVTPTIPVSLEDCLEDPGEMTKAQVLSLCRSQLRRLKDERRGRHQGRRKLLRR